MKKQIISNKSFLLNKFVKLIEENHEELTELFMNDLLKHPETDAYRNSDRDGIYRFSNLVYNMDRWGRNAAMRGFPSSRC